MDMIEKDCDGIYVDEDERRDTDLNAEERAFGSPTCIYAPCFSWAWLFGNGTPCQFLYLVTATDFDLEMRASCCINEGTRHPPDFGKSSCQT